MLADHERVGPLGLRRTADEPGHLVVDVDRAQAAGHVGDVDAPAVEVVRRPQPARDDRVRAVDHRRAQRGVVVVELGQRAVAHPALVGAVGQEVVERPRRRALDVARGDEPLVGVAGVVGRQVAEDPPAALVHGGREPDVRRVAAEQRVDLLERRRVVAVVALAGEDRRRVDDADPDVGEVVEVLGDRRRGRRRRTASACAGRSPRTRPRPPTRPAPPRPGSRARRRRPSARTGPGRPGRRPRRGPSPAAAWWELSRKSKASGGSWSTTPTALSQRWLVGCVQQEPVVRHRVVHRQRALPPDRVLVARGRRCRGGRSARRRTSCAPRPARPGRSASVRSRTVTVEPGAGASSSTYVGEPSWCGSCRRLIVGSFVRGARGRPRRVPTGRPRRRGW